MNKIIFTLLLFSFSFSGIVDLNRATQIAQNFSNSRAYSFALDQVDIVEENNTIYAVCDDSDALDQDGRYVFSSEILKEINQKLNEYYYLWRWQSRFYNSKITS